MTAGPEGREQFSADDFRAYEEAFVRRHGPIPPGLACPIGWRPNALAPVFFGVHDYGLADGAPVNLRVFFPSLDGAVFTAPILQGCGRYPLLIFAHGDCHPDTAHYRKWFHLPSQLARSGYVVVIPELPSISTPPETENHPAMAAIQATRGWISDTWSERHALLRHPLLTQLRTPVGGLQAAPVTGILGHSHGALLAGRIARSGGAAAYASLSGRWQHDWFSSPRPIEGLEIPKLFIWGGADSGDELTDGLWNSLSLPKHRAVFATGMHWDYLWAQETPCRQDRGPCRYLPYAVADLVTMFFAKYLTPEYSSDLSARIPDSLRPPPLTLTLEQEFYAGGHLRGMQLIEGRSECQVLLDWRTPNTRLVPHVLYTPSFTADNDVRRADLVPQFTNQHPPGAGIAWVASQSPRPGTKANVGDTVRMTLRTGPIP